MATQLGAAGGRARSPVKAAASRENGKRGGPHPDHTVTVTWSDGARANVSLAPFLKKGGVFEALKGPGLFRGED